MSSDMLVNIGSDKGMDPNRHQGISWANPNLSTSGHFETIKRNLNQITNIFTEENEFET